MENNNPITYFGQTDFRNKKTRFGIRALDRTKHMYVIGKTGMGKSTLLENMAIQDIQNGEGIGFIDPHGGTAEKLLDYIPEHRIKDVVYFAPFDTDFPVSFNVMEDVGVDKRHLVASGLMSSFKKIWVDAWSARMEYILNNILLALLEYPGATLLGVNRMLSDKDYRKKVVDNISDPSVKAFWTDEFAKYGEKYMQEAGAAIQNKIGQFTSNPLIRNIIGQPTSSFDVRKAMDEKKIVIMNLSKGRVGEQNASLLGGMLITKIYLGAMSRADASAVDMAKLPNFYFYVDEFQSFTSDTFADILSEARKYKLNLTIAHQYVEQLSEVVRAAVFGNVGTTITFRVGPFDAEILEKIFSPKFLAEDIVNLGFAQIYLSLMIDGVGSAPFSATTLDPIAPPTFSYKDQILKYSREQNARPRAGVEEEIRIWHETNFNDKPKFKENREDGGERFPQNDRPYNAPMRQEQRYEPRREFTPAYPPRDRVLPPRPQAPQTPQAPKALQAPRPPETRQPFREVFKAKPEEARVQAPPIVERKTYPNPKSDFRSPAPETEAQLPKQTSPLPRAQKPELYPHTASPKLKDLLHQLEGDEKPAENAKTVKENSTFTPPLAPKEMSRPISLSSLKKTFGTQAPTGNLTSLKETLANALKNSGPAVPKAMPAPASRPAPASTPISNQPPIAPAPNPVVESSQLKTPHPEPVTKTQREIPEDVLRKILE